MSQVFHHEQMYRGADAIERLGALSVTICGAGALGSNLADNLTRQGLRRLTVIDDDKVEEHNAGTQIYTQDDVGARKVEVLRSHCFRATGAEVSIHPKRLEGKNVKKLLRGADLVLDTFDNSASRRLVTDHCTDHRVPCLHLGVNADFGEVRWNENYLVPSDVTGVAPCDYPLARNLILLVVAAGSEAVLRFALEDRREEYEVTLRDLRIHSGA